MINYPLIDANIEALRNTFLSNSAQIAKMRRAVKSL